MAIIEWVSDHVLFVAAGCFLVAAVCFMYIWWMQHQEDRRYHSYEPLDPDEE